MIDVVGIGAAGYETVGATERRLITTAARVLGSERQLDLLPDVAGQQRLAWPRPLRPALPALLGDHEEVATVVLASGDPLLAGIGSTVVEVFGAAAVRVHPVVSSVALARARMRWSAESAEVVRLLDPSADALRRWLAPDRRLVVLSRDAGSPSSVAAVLQDAGFGGSALTVLSDLGGHTESRIDTSADLWGEQVAAELNVVCVTCVAGEASALWSNGPGLPDEAYEHDGQLTKRDLRASALAHLMPVAGQLLWDVGAGAGSVGIEWLRTQATCRAIAVEQEPVRVARIVGNAARLGVPGLQVVEGSAPAALQGLPRPDAVFVGGGVSKETIELAWRALAGGGRLVVHAVTWESEAQLMEAFEAHGGELTRIAVEHLEPLGGFLGWRPARAVVQWSAQKKLELP
ncbi:MAG TPA: precorrin-6y C5,15-methyltransferase (decarboxylating) subunit CbiE [Propionibacteriaceae bacterium]|nr:precorrin-6y C5,15-methyltransferase (decarboxylating) subunit CbiE [Propionibacteriaceae bacterium]